MATVYYRQTYVPVQGADKASYDMIGELIEAGGGPPSNPPMVSAPVLPTVEKLFKTDNGNLYEQIGDDKWVHCGNDDSARITQMGLVQVDTANEAAVRSTLQQYYRGEITVDQISPAQG